MKPRVKRSIHINRSEANKIPVFIKFFASGFWTGYVPAFSGTVASFVALLFYFLLSLDQWTYLLVLCCIFFIVGIKASNYMIPVYGNDPAEVTIDEFVGMWISLLFFPKTILISLGAFILFRIFDIVKPYPIETIDKLHGGLAIMLDDVVAGIYANVTLRIVLMIPSVHSFLTSL